MWRLAAAVLASAALVADASEIRGVPFSKAHLYSGAEFKCADGGLAMPANRVNDDYCDCPDGSDEPGTSACPNGTFFCENRGYRGQTVPSTVVNDGVCDCCDGADEFARAGACANTCEEDGREWRRLQAERIRAAETGAAAKQAYIEKGRSVKAQAQAKAAEAAAKVEELERRFKDVSAKIKAEETAASQRQAQADDARDDAIVKALGLDKLTVVELAHAFVRLARDAAVTDKAVTLAKDMAEDVAAAAGEDEIAARDAVSWPTDDTLAAVVASATASATSTSGGEPLAALRDEKSRIETEKHTAENDKTEADRDASTDFGPNGEFYPLKGKCFDLMLAQYKYQVCPFDKAQQDYTSLGRYEGWDPASGYRIMNFRGGLRCWNGPDRSLSLHLRCGSEDKVISVDEPGKCEYMAVMETPAACDERFAEALRLELNEPARAEEL